MVNSREVAGGKVTALSERRRDGRSVASFHGRLHGMTTRAKKIRTQFAHVSIGLWQSIPEILLGARTESVPGRVMSVACIVQTLCTCVFRIIVSCSVVEDGPHTDAMEGSVTNGTQNDLMAFALGRTDARFRRRKTVFAARRSRLLKTPANSWLCVVAFRVFRLRGWWMRLTQLNW